ncbi:MAG: ORF6N domain-containing protein [Bacteroidales bacterium]|nr:ORF6N domain-containing protein [Bacteroidales bacterium]
MNKNEEQTFGITGGDFEEEAEGQNEAMNLVPAQVYTPQLVGEIQPLIKTFRGVQVILDKDLARLYEVETRTLNQTVKRNIERFPDSFMFQLTMEECSRSQFVILNTKRGQNVKYLPYVFTEQGVAMLSSVLRSPTAVSVSIKIIEAFVTMRRLVSSSVQIFHRLDTIEYNQLEMRKRQDIADGNIEKVFQLMNRNERLPMEGIFYDGQIFDAHTFVCDLIRSAKERIVLIDNYIDDSVLKRLDKREVGVSAIIYTQRLSPTLQTDINTHNAQYPAIEVRVTDKVHDRFMIIDNTVYHLGASVKDLGKKVFAFSKMAITPDELIDRINV